MYLLQQFWHEEEAASATEYAVLIVLIILVALVAIIFLGEQVRDAFERFSEEFSGAGSS